MKKIKVFYNPKQTAKTNSSFSPSATKPAEVVKQWNAKGFPIEIVDFEPVSRDELSLAHDIMYVDGVLDLQLENGFNNTLPEIRDSLLWTNGSFVAAACDAVESGGVTVSPTSGFHHANYASGGGFCTFNGLMVAAKILEVSGVAKKVGIVDLDAHYGDGTDQIIHTLDFGPKVRHYTFGRHHITPANADKWLQDLIFTLRDFKDCDVILYQAGADPHIDDPLGGALTSEQMRLRDRIVFKTFKDLGIPVAWNLAGGYQDPLQKVLDIHNATMKECVEAYIK